MSYTKQRTPDGHFQASPLPDEEELKEFYAHQYYQERSSATYQKQYSEEELKYKQLLAEQMIYALQQVEQTPTKDHAFLEVGFGEGFGLAAAQRKGWGIRGIDLSSYALSSFHPELLPFVIIGDAYEELKALKRKGETFSAIVLQNVLEHVRDPREILQDIVGLLKEGGLVSVTLPNDESDIQHSALESGDIDKEYWFCPPQHLHYFNIEMGIKFAEECGLDVCDVYSDFPIEFYLFHPGSNYVRTPDAGRAAHSARVRLTALLAKRGLEAFHALGQAQARCGIGRAFTMVLRPAAR